MNPAIVSYKYTTQSIQELCQTTQAASERKTNPKRNFAISGTQSTISYQARPQQVGACTIASKPLENELSEEDEIHYDGYKERFWIRRIPACKRG